MKSAFEEYASKAKGNILQLMKTLSHGCMNTVDFISNCLMLVVEDEINVPIALSAFRDKSV